VLIGLIYYFFEDSRADDLLENDFCDVLKSFSPDSCNSFSCIRHASDLTLELKPFPNFIKCIYLGPNETFPMIVASNLTEDQDGKLLKVLMENTEEIRWSLGDIKGISPSIVQHRTHFGG